MAPELSIIVPTLDRLDTLADCLASVARHTHVSHEVIVYANAYDAATAALLQGYPGVRVLRSRDNKFFTAAVNEALREVRGRYVFLLNDDCELLRDDWFPVYRDLLEQDQRIAAVGPHWKNIAELPYGWIEPYASLYPRWVFERFGPLPYFDDSFVLWWSDIYHTYKLMHAGCYVLPLSRELCDRYVWHKRDGESGETVKRMRPTLPGECFAFHGREVMYRRLGITDPAALVGYYGGRVWSSDAVLGAERGAAAPAAPGAARDAELLAVQDAGRDGGRSPARPRPS